MKVLRKLKNIVLDLPPSILKRTDGTKISKPAPLSAALKFCNEIDVLESSGLNGHAIKAAVTKLLMQKHLELFDVAPEAGTSLSIVKARCVYRLQYLGHEQTKVPPSEKFLQNYRAIMQFRNDFDGCAQDTAGIGTLLAHYAEGEVTMSAVKKATKSKSTSKSGKEVKSNSKQVKVFDTYSVAGCIRWLADRCNADTAQVREVIRALGLENKVAATTIVTTIADQGNKKYRKDPPSMQAEHADKLRNLLKKGREALEKLEAQHEKQKAKTVKVISKSTKKPIKVISKRATRNAK